MALIKGKNRTTTAVSRESEGNDQYVRVDSSGAVVTKDWRQSMVDEGRTFVITVGAFLSPATGGGVGTILDLDQPDVVINVPNGTSIWPKRIHVGVKPGLFTTDSDITEVLIAVDQDKRLDTSVTPGTSTTETIYNLNTLYSRSSNCVAESQHVGDTTDPVLDIELAHVVRIFDIHTAGTKGGGENIRGFDVLYEPDAPPKINGPAALCVYWGGTVAALAYATVEWYEL